MRKVHWGYGSGEKRREGRQKGGKKGERGDG